MAKKGLKLQRIGKNFNGFWAVRDVTAGILPGRITAFVGPNGAGKTTLFHLITGELKPDEGKIHFNGKNITGYPPWKVARFGIGKQFQDVRVFENLTAIENVSLSLFRNGEDKALWAFRNFYRIGKKRREFEERGMEFLEFVGLEDKKTTLARELSFGQQKLLSFARLIAGDFDLLLLDEPTAGVSPMMIEKIVALLGRLKDERGKTIAIIEHNMSVVSKVADWVYFMHEGKVVFTGRTDHVLGHNEVRELYMGL